MHRTIAWLAPALALMSLAGCGAAPAGPPDLPLPEAPMARALQASGSKQASPAPPEADRYMAFTACRRGDLAGGFFVWDAQLQDVYVLNGALAGLVPYGKQVGGPEDCDQIAQLNPTCFGTFKVLFSFGTKIFVYDPVTEERITAATDGRPLAEGGPLAALSSDGKLLAYVSFRGTLVLKPTHPVYATKTRELTKIAAEIAAFTGRKGYGGVLQDFDLSGDGKWLVLNVDGAVYLYDILCPRLYQVAPLDGEALAGLGDGFGDVAISSDGRYVACTLAGRRLLVFDRQTQQVDTVPYANLGDGLEDQAVIFAPLFGGDGRSLYFEALVGGTFKVWRYDLLNETLRALVILNNVLGEDADDLLVSEPGLGP